jgi:hypothetical protein
MNILQAFLKKYKQFIILIIGMPCTSKSDIAKELGIDLELPLININKYIKPDKFVVKEVEGIKFKLYEDIENYDWDKLNNDVNEKKTNGVILYGNYLDNTKIDFKIDFSFFINMNSTLCKNTLIEKKILDIEDEKKLDIYFKEIFIPLYEKIKESIIINKYFNIKNDTDLIKMYDTMFDILMKLIQEGLVDKKLNNEKTIIKKPMNETSKQHKLIISKA